MPLEARAEGGDVMPCNEYVFVGTLKIKIFKDIRLLELIDAALIS